MSQTPLATFLIENMTGFLQENDPKAENNNHFLLNSILCVSKLFLNSGAQWHI